MKAIHYDVEGDILTVTFAETRSRKHTGIELTENIVLYYEPDTESPLQLVLIGYRAMARASARRALPLTLLNRLPASRRDLMLRLLRRPSVAYFLRLVENGRRARIAGKLGDIFIPEALKAVA